MFITNVLYRWMYNAADANNSLCVSVVVKKVSNSSSKNLPLQVAHVAFACRLLALACACACARLRLSSFVGGEKGKEKNKEEVSSTFNHQQENQQNNDNTSNVTQPTTANNSQ